MPNKQNLKAIDAWQAEHVEKILIKPRKEEHLSERIKLAIDKGYAKSRQGFIIEAVLKMLDEMGIPKIEE